MWTAAATAAPPIHYRRKIFEADNGVYTGSFAVDFAVDASEDADSSLPPRTAYYQDEEFSKLGSEDHRPMLVVLHGLSGGSYEVYLRHCVEPLISNGADWQVCVVNAVSIPCVLQVFLGQRSLSLPSVTCCTSSAWSTIQLTERKSAAARIVKLPAVFCLTQELLGIFDNL
jgi:hypothetical protein